MHVPKEVIVLFELPFQRIHLQINESCCFDVRSEQNTKLNYDSHQTNDEIHFTRTNENIISEDCLSWTHWKSVFSGRMGMQLEIPAFFFKLDSFKIKIPFSIANICLSYVIRKMNKVLKLPHEKKTPHETNFTFFICICSKNQIWNWRQNASFRWNSQIAMIE